ncbi:MAG: hypothetical protein V4648_01785 [Bacteroidota bacterium]
MKTTIMTLAIALFSMANYAQNKNVQETTKTTTTSVKTNDGERKIVKKENVKEVQNIELKEPQPNTINVDTKETPVTVTATTQITNPDGTIRTVDVDRSSYYMSNGTKYKLTRDASGYTVTYGTGKPAVLRQTSTNSYVFRNNDRTAVGYFDTNGDLILEVYDDKTDKVTLEKYIIVKP